MSVQTKWGSPLGFESKSKRNPCVYRHGPLPSKVPTRRELQVLVLIGEGWSQLEVARALGIGKHRVRELMASVSKRLQLKHTGKPGIVAYWQREKAAA